MKKIKGEELVSFINSTSNKKIGIFDNNTVSFLAKAEKYILTTEVLNFLLFPLST